MYDYPDQIKSFLNHSFTPVEEVLSNVKMTTGDLLEFLWNAFPKDCITEYNLVEILNHLDHKQQMYVVENYHEFVDDDKNKKIRITRKIEIGWCFKTAFDLREEVIDR